MAVSIVNPNPNSGVGEMKVLWGLPTRPPAESTPHLADWQSAAGSHPARDRGKAPNCCEVLKRLTIQLGLADKAIGSDR
jgi:hypothetical protein